MNEKLAQIQIAPDGGFKGFGIYGLENSTAQNSAPTVFNSFLSKTIGVITIVGFIWFLFILITGALGIMGSGSDKAAAEAARKKISTGLIGLVVLVAAIFLFRLVGQILGIENIGNPGELINNISN